MDDGKIEGPGAPLLSQKEQAKAKQILCWAVTLHISAIQLWSCLATDELTMIREVNCLERVPHPTNSACAKLKKRLKHS